MRVEYGNLPVPQPVPWSEEEEFWVAECPYFKAPAIQQRDAQGNGKPYFGRVHPSRQRKLIALGLCDICGKSLRNRTKISLSHAGEAGLVIEPLMHVECAMISMRHCPALQEQMKSNMATRLSISHVFRYDVVPLAAQPEDLARYVPEYDGPPIVGLAAIKVLDHRPVVDLSDL